MTRVAVFGCGLIGGSLALALRAAGREYHVTALDQPAVILDAEARSCADAFVDVNDEAQVSEVVAASDVTVLSAPVSVIAERLPWVLDRARVVTDCGSTKRHIVERARSSVKSRRFVPGHPMAGLPGGGIRNAVATLFEGKNWLLCPEQSDPDAVAIVERMIHETRAKVVHMQSDSHDAAVARTSHLPQLLASALSLIVEQHSARAAAGPAFERATLTAGGPAPIWRDIFATNGDEIARAIVELCSTLEPLARELADGEQTTLADELLARARALKP
jgi:prephenate dehydrogenase